MRKLVFALISSIALASCAANTPQRGNPLTVEQAQALKISEIVVDTAGADYSQSATPTPTLGADLKTALDARFADRRAPGGMVMKVEVTQVIVASQAATAYGTNKPALSGFARLYDSKDAAEPAASYRIRFATGTQGDGLIGFAIAAAVNSGTDFYTELVSGFANSTYAKVTE